MTSKNSGNQFSGSVYRSSKMASNNTKSTKNKRGKKRSIAFLSLLALILLALYAQFSLLSKGTDEQNENPGYVFAMKRYLFNPSQLYKKQGQRFVKTDTLIKPGIYQAEKREQHRTRPNFLFIPELEGWILEVYTSAAPKMKWKPGTNLSIGTERVDKWYALPFAYRPNDMVRLNARYCKIRRILLRQEAARAFIRMRKAALQEGVKFYGFSGFRSAATQKRLYLRRIKIGKKFKQQAVARPGHSEHQLGTTVDVVGPNTALAARSAYARTQSAKWLKKNCYDYGFVLSYGRDNKIQSGYIYESWHFRYIGLENVGEWLKKHHKDKSFVKNWLKRHENI